MVAQAGDREVRAEQVSGLGRRCKMNPIRRQSSAHSQKAWRMGTRSAYRAVQKFTASSGATRVEDTPNSTSCGSTPAFISISDPSAGVRYEINVQKSTYHQITLRTAPAQGTARSGWPAGGHKNGHGDQVQTTSLGTQPVSGTSLSAEGTQTTITIPADKIGNAQPIVITSTRWYSPDLKIVIQSSSGDPRGGTRSLQLSGITIAEPAA